MIRFLKFLITGDWHIHTYETISNYDLRTSYNNSTGNRVLLRCTKCGRWKKQDLI